MRFRTSWALSGISRPSALSTDRTEAMACTVVQTPQMRWVNTHASRGSRPFKIVSMPRHMVPEDQAFLTAPPSTSTSMRRWPSMRVTGSMVMSLLMGRFPLASAAGGGAHPGVGSPQRDRLAVLDAAQDGEELHEDGVDRHADGGEAAAEQHLADPGEVAPPGRGLVRDEVGVEAVERAREEQEERRAEELPAVRAPGRQE